MSKSFHGLDVSRRSVLGGAVGGALLAALPASAHGAASARRELPGQGHYLIRGCALISVDPDIGTQKSTDIRVRDGAIAEIGNGLAPGGAELIEAGDMIAMPGFVDTHWHMWGSVGRNFVSDTHNYMTAKKAVAKLYTPDDVYASLRLALAEAIDAGVTGVLNFAHNVRSPAHADAEIRAHHECGVRAIYSYGYPDELGREEAMDLRDLRRVAGEMKGGKDALVRLGAAIRGSRHSTEEIYDEEMRTILSLGLPVTYHGGQSRRATVSAVDMRERGYLDKGTVLAHYLYASPEDRKAMRETGASLSFSTMGEFRSVGDAGGDPRAQLLEMAADGVNVSLSVDANSIMPVDMFENMRTAWRYGKGWVGDPRTENLPDLTLPQVVRMATLNGAKAILADHLSGSITVGKRADLILVRTTDINLAPRGDLYSMVVRQARASNVDTVLIDGRIMKRAGRITGLDLHDVLGAATATAQSLRRRAGGWLAEGL